MSSVTEVQQMVNDTEGVYFPLARVYDAVNSAILDSWAKQQLVDATLTLNTLDDIVSIPPTIMIPQYVTYLGEKYYFATMADLERYSRVWRGHTPGLPKWFIRWDASHLRIWPQPDQTYDMIITGIAWPTGEVSGSNSDVGWERDYELAVTNLAASQLLTFSRPDLSRIRAEEAKAYLNNYKVFLRNAQPHNIRRLRIGNKYDRAGSGSIYDRTKTVFS